MFAQDKLQNITPILTSGGLILYPTDTIWGIGCDATNPLAIERIFRLKQSDRKESFVILVDSINMLRKYVDQVPPRLETLLHYHHRPLTVVYQGARNLARNVSCENGTIPIRVVQDEFCKKLIRKLGKPIVAASANLINEAVPHNFGGISSAIIEQIDYVVKYRQYEKYGGEPAVMVSTDSDGELTFLRE